MLGEDYWVLAKGHARMGLWPGQNDAKTQKDRHRAEAKGARYIVYGGALKPRPLKCFKATLSRRCLEKSPDAPGKQA